MPQTNLVIWLQFLACAAGVSIGGFELCVSAEKLGRAWGLGASWVGLALLASVTSLPELITGASAVTLAQSPNIAVGDALGSCVINLAFLVVADFMLRDEPLYRTASSAHILAGAFGIVLLGFIGLNILLSHIAGFHLPAFAGIGLYSPMLLLIYFVALRLSFRYERDHAPGQNGETVQAERRSDTAKILARFLGATLLVAALGVLLPVVGARLADAMQWNRSFVGTLLVATSTSLPELAVTLSALRLRALDLAVGNLLGSNLFNAAIVAFDDVLYRRGPLLSHVSALHAVTAMSAVVMTALAMIGIFYRPSGRVLRAVGWISIGLVAVYLLNTYVAFIYGE